MTLRWLKPCSMPKFALRTSRGEEVSNMKFGGEVEEITGVEQFRAAITLPGELYLIFFCFFPRLSNQAYYALISLLIMSDNSVQVLLPDSRHKLH